MATPMLGARSSDRHFRVAFLDSLGLKGVQERNKLETMLKQFVIDVVALRRLLERFEIPSHLRSTVWKVLLGILPPYAKTWKFIKEQLEEQYLDLKRATALIVKGLIIEEDIKNNCRQDSAAGYVSKTKESICAVYKTHQQLLNREKDDVEGFELDIIAVVFCEVCDNESDAYWGMYRFLNFAPHVGPRRIAITIQLSLLSKLIESRESKLWNHFKAADVQVSHFSYGWFRSMFATVFPRKTLASFWDTLIGLPDLYNACVALAILTIYMSQILQQGDALSINNYIRKIVVSNTRDILQKAMVYYRSESEFQKNDLSRK